MRAFYTNTPDVDAESAGAVIMTTKKGIFISHIHEDARLGAVVKSWLTDAFHGNAAPFLSSDKQDLPAGSKWLDIIENQLAETGVMISLLSPISLARPWVNIELGAAWIRRIPIIPLCHSGQQAGALPKPFNDFTGLTLGDTDSAKDLIAGVATALGLTYSQRLAFTESQKELLAAAAKSESAVVLATVETPTADLPPEQLTILRTLAEYGNQNGDDPYVNGSRAPAMCGLKPMVFKYHSEQLEDAGLIISGYWTDEGDGSHYKNLRRWRRLAHGPRPDARLTLVRVGASRAREFYCDAGVRGVSTRGVCFPSGVC